MGSRRVVTRSYSGDGRSGFNNGDDVTGSSRSSGLSYLSGVRPENSQSRHRYSQYRQSRSTFCSVMAHLTEETQPSFESTLKSRAVSEASNVKFICVVTGNPAPEVTWYKDDVQLDRYCGLPKYEVSRNGQNHSLHIYNCTLEDAAIYQASARNSKGIVSCSGVLEVGTMSEYKIHQQYFAKLKQKAENKRRDLENPKLWEKEHHGPGRQEQLRTISPDRSQRKRRSPMEASLSTPSSIEEEGAEENISVPDSESEVRLQETSTEGIDNSIPVTNGTASSISGGQPAKENGSNGLTYIYDSVQKTFSAQPPKAPFAKKKIKISNGVGHVNSDSQVEIVPDDRGISEEANVSTYQIDSSYSQRTDDEAMEVESSAPDDIQENNSSVSVLQEKVQVEGTAPLNKDPSLDPFTAVSPSVKEIRGKNSENDVEKENTPNMESKEPKVEREVESKDILKNVGANSPISSEPKPRTSVTPIQVLNTSVVEVKTCPEDGSIMEVDVKSLHKPLQLNPINKPSSLEPTHESSSLEPTHKPSSLKPTHKPSLLKPTHKPSALEPTHKPSSLKPTHKPSLLKPTHKPSALEPTHKPSALEPKHKPSPLKPINKPSALEPTHKPSPLKPINKPSSVELSELESIHSTLVNKSKVTVEDPATVGVGGLCSDTSINGAAAIMGPDSVATPCDRENGFPQHPCEQSRDQLSGKETSSSPKNASVSLPPLRAEVTQAHTQTERNEAPVNPEPLTTRSELDVQFLPQPPSEREVTTDANQTPTLHNASRTSNDEIAQSTWDHSGGSRESHTLPFKEALKSPLESLGDSENSLGCNISPTLLPGQVEKAIKTVGGTKIQDEKIVEGTGGLRVQKDNFASLGEKAENETDVEMERTVNQLENQNGNNSVMDVAGVEMEKNVAVLKAKKCPVIQKNNCQHLSLETIPDSTQLTDTNSNPSAQKPNDSKDLPKPVASIMSVADLLRAQLKAFSSTLISSATPIQNPVHCFNADLQPTLPQSAAVQDIEPNPMIRMDDTELIKNSGKPKIGKETNNCFLSAGSDVPSGLEEHRRDTETKLVQSTSIVSPTIETSTTEFDIPSISIRDKRNTFENRNPNMAKENDCVMDTGQDAPLENKPNVCLIGPESIQIDSALLTQNPKLASGVTLISVPPLDIFQEHKQVQENTTDEIDSLQSVLPKVSIQHHQVSCPSVLSSLSCDTEKLSYTKKPECLINTTPIVPPFSDNCLKNTQPDTAMFVDQLEGHQHDMPQLSSQTMQRLDSHVPALGPETQEPKVPTINLPCSKTKDIKLEDTKMDYLVSVSNIEENSLFRKGDIASPLPSATPQELASGARRKIFIPKSKGDDADTTPPPDSQSPREEVPRRTSRLSPETPSLSPSFSRKSPLLQPPSGQANPFPAEKRSPLPSRRKVASDAPKQMQEPAQTDTAKPEEKPAEKDKHNPFKAPQVIRKIRGEPFSDASGHLKLWCQFFNVLSDSTIKWYRDDVQIAEVKRSAGDETLVALAIVQTSSRDCGVYGCTINNEYGTDSTDFLLSIDILAGMFLREDLEVGEEIEMTPMLFNKGLVDSGLWGSKFFGRIMMTENHIGEGCSHKTCRAKVIYGLEPVFESGTTCIIKVRNPIAYGAKEEGNLIERNLANTQLECRIHNIAREYCKIFAAETRVIENFGPALEVIPLYLMYRPANTIPHATVEADLTGVYLKYCFQDATGRLIMRAGSEVEQKCCALQHWVHQWTNGNLLLTHLEGVDTKITNIGISIQTKGYQGLTAMGNPKVFEQFVSQHQCNYYCGLLSLRALKAVELLQTPIKPKGSRSPMLHRKMTPGSSSPLTPRKTTASPRVSRKSESEDTKANTKFKAEETTKVVG
ncbi:alpha-protein kinase 3 isoform X1 [Hypomesus transpacificus]|uniref:alpha-protein kinase 3 isoform X1 n=1 Tax=Hypomesus transpacificus TaxID=137520 RepID=UPI001F079FFC|nr:alpha-protein kinase 3 isoform X1 [Hypomesus transpacificus]